MIDWLQQFADRLNWLAVISSLVVNVVFIITILKVFKAYIRRRRLFIIKRNQEGLCVLSIGLGMNNPYNAVIDFIGQESKDRIVSYHKAHKGDIEGHLDIEEIQKALTEIRSIVGRLRRDNYKEVLVFYAGPVSAAFQIGYLFKSYAGSVKFMQFDQKNKTYMVMATSTS